MRPDGVVVATVPLCVAGSALVAVLGGALALPQPASATVAVVAASSCPTLLIESPEIRIGHEP